MVDVPVALPVQVPLYRGSHLYDSFGVQPVSRTIEIMEFFWEDQFECSGMSAGPASSTGADTCSKTVALLRGFH